MIIKIVYIENGDNLGFESLEKLEKFLSEDAHNKFLSLSLKYSSIKFITEEQDKIEEDINLFCKKIIFYKLYENQNIVYRDYHKYWVFAKNKKNEWKLICTDWCLSTDYYRF